VGVLKEWLCTFHEHEFEAEEPICPYGCAARFVRREFRTAPGYKSDVTRATDNIRRQLASDYNMTDVRGDKEGTSAMSNTPVSSGGARLPADAGKPYWKPDLVPQGWMSRGEAAPSVNTASLLPPLRREGNRDVPTRIPIEHIRSGSQSYLQKATRFVGPAKK
jgi:hypothetical protein